MDYTEEEIMNIGQKEVEAAGSKCAGCSCPLSFGDEIWINLKKTKMLCYECRSDICYDYEEGQIVRATGPHGAPFVIERPGCPCSNYLYMVTKHHNLLSWANRYEDDTPYGCCPIVLKKKKIKFKIRKHKICV